MGVGACAPTPLNLRSQLFELTLPGSCLVTN
jgi:hypothetical protein